LRRTAKNEMCHISLFHSYEPMIVTYVLHMPILVGAPLLLTDLEDTVTCSLERATSSHGVFGSSGDSAVEE